MNQLKMENKYLYEKVDDLTKKVRFLESQFEDAQPILSKYTQILTSDLKEPENFEIEELPSDYMMKFGNGLIS